MKRVGFEPTMYNTIDLQSTAITTRPPFNYYKDIIIKIIVSLKIIIFRTGKLHKFTLLKFPAYQCLNLKHIKDLMKDIFILIFFQYLNICTSAT